MGSDPTPRAISDLLYEQRVFEVNGWALTDVWGVSGDGKTIVGSGLAPCSATHEAWIARIDGPAVGPSMFCYANCDASCSGPILNANDFQCFLNRYAAGDPWANCDGSTAPPVLNINDFQCFVNKYAAGCS
jgi:hypothetical protein